MKPTSFKLSNRDAAHDISYHSFARLGAVGICNICNREITTIAESRNTWQVTVF